MNNTMPRAKGNHRSTRTTIQNSGRWKLKVNIVLRYSLANVLPDPGGQNHGTEKCDNDAMVTEFIA